MSSSNTAAAGADVITSNSQPKDASPPPDITPEPRNFPSFSSSLARFDEQGDKSEEHIPPNSSLGQFSFAPATQTTVVTTTTTTTTSFPPFILRPPRTAQSLDAKIYPLASNPTPASIKDIRFKIGDNSIVFNEPEDTLRVLDEFKEQHESLKASNGTVRSLESFNVIESPSSRCSLRPRFPPKLSPAAVSNPRRRRPVSPESLPESSQVVKRTHISADAPPEPAAGIHATQAHPDGLRNESNRQSDVGLATPETETGSFNLGTDRNPQRRIRSLGPFGVHSGSSFGSSSILDENRRPSSPKSSMNRTTLNLRSFSSDQSPLIERRSGLGVSRVGSSHPINGRDDREPQSLRERNGQNSSASVLRRGALRAGTRLRDLDSIAAQDMCLPSPSLSPVAAMNSQNIDASFDYAEDQETDTDSSLDHQSKKLTNLSDIENDSSRAVTQRSLSTARHPASTMSLMDMPMVLGYFESVPDELKTYMMYQMLRRCPKSTLHFVADVVNPALKCDFLALLPLELSLNIVKYFDVQTMCRASQVSKKWRHIINSDEKSWKKLFEQDGYVLPEGELQRAIQEGWGWQHPGGEEDCEKDLRPSTATDSEFTSPTISSLALTAANQNELESAPLSGSRRLKRKAPFKATSRKSSRRKGTMQGRGDQVEQSQWLDSLTAAESPYAAANAAAQAVPYPDVGLPSLRSLHLYKSLYQRHYLIQKTWMRDDVKPMHIAFRAHDRHVVTCLQFDTDKILTGSDDTNIHVYDTKTGALKATLEGHEGGVWALEYHGNTLVSGSTDRSVRVWDIEAAECTQVFQGHTSTVRCLQILLPAEIGKTPDGTPIMMPKEPLIITGSRDSTLRVWKLPQPGDPKIFQAGPAPDDRECPYFVRTLQGHQHSVRAIAAHGDTLVSGSYDCTVRVWKISTGEAIHRLQGHNLKVYSVVLDHKRNRCISGSMDNLVKVWSLETGAVLYNLEGHSSLVGLLDLKADRLVSAAADSTLRIWDPETGHCKSKLSAHTGAITCFQHDSQKVISGSDRTLKMWDVRTGECIKDLLTDLNAVWQVKFNDRRCVAAVQRDRMTYIEILDFGASRDRVPSHRLGRRIVVDVNGEELKEEEEFEDEINDNDLLESSEP
ncbi:hypothetical protein AJ80_08808 [Polytolypa hystricis UAMH7299]|uniref:Probable E3 ubiquitin ligase complex SCF subunit sconB n=1 Tax=Polytolypa hystricis (strain UAMH7299) TaxID=1447883 RepID=A0A2B7X1P9_POLH7|nr:hypothetical protein AJ80_08808 [Polytolypa hystricis UAMH7299]